ncbi:MAG: MBL fold metallo-hydrolase [Bdellovibrionales bacterium]|nr:MBL fold metallo-hydrolase [Bdellovibrionales bacterium]
MKVQHFFDEPTFTLTFVAYDPDTKDAVIIDPVLNYEPWGSTLSHESFEELVGFVEKHGLNVHYILETHAHADHLTSAQLLKEKYPQAKTAIHENIKLVQETFKGLFNFDDEFDTEGKVFDKLLKDGEVFNAGSIKIEVIHTPGHTPACVTYLINDKAAFTGDAIFMPDYGTGRCDFPKGSAKDLYHSIHEKIYKLNDDIEIYVGHDYQPGGRKLEFKTTVGEEKNNNIQIKEVTTEKDFVSFREERDKTLMAPKLLLASIQVNAQNGQLPPKEDNGMSYLKYPIR